MCQRTAIGTDYVGTLNVTDEGVACQFWASQTPHPHEYYTQDSDFPDGSVKRARNYCGHPNDTDGGPWCYTVDPDVRWQRCDVPTCIPRESDKS